MLYELILILMLNEVLSMDPNIKDLLTPSRQSGEACGYESCPRLKEGMINIHIVPHTHGELGFTRTFHGHYTGTDDFFETTHMNMKRILDYTISELWADETRKFTFSDTPYLFHWWANRDATVRRMVYQLLRQGRLYIIGGAWGMADEATTSYHAIIDQYTYSLRKLNATFLQCGLPLVGWQADVFGHSREFASLLANMGFDGLFINPISFDDELARMQRKSLEFLWRGSDDLGASSDIYTHKLFDGYWSPPGFCFGSQCNSPLLISSDDTFSNIEERVELFIQSMVHRQSPYYLTRNVMVMMGQMFGYYDAALWFGNIDKLINEVNKRSYSKGANLHLFYSTPACYLKAVHEANPELEIKQDDFFPMAYDKFTHTTGMYTSRPTLKLMAREGHVFLQMSKQLQVLARLWNNDKLFEEFMWIMGVYQDHNVITGGLRAHVKDYYTDKMYVAVQKSTLLLKQAFNKLRGSSLSTIYYRCSFNISKCLNTDSEESFVVIYNPLAWPVSIAVRLPIQNFEYNVYNPKVEIVNACVIKTPQAILNIPERVTQADHELVFMADDLPPLGFRSYYIQRTNREKRGIIKRINKKRKHITRQINPKVKNETLSDDLHEDYYYFDDVTTNKTETNVNVAKAETVSNGFDFILTEKPMENVGDGIIVSDVIKSSQNTTLKDDVIYQDADFNKPPGSETKVASTTETRREFLNRIRTSKPNNFKDVKNQIPDPGSEDSGYRYKISKDTFIKNKYIQIHLDSSRKVTNMTLINGVSVALDIQFYFYESDDPQRLGRGDKKQPGAYIFRPLDPKPIPIIDFIDTVIYKTDLVEEIHSRYANYASFVLRLYKEKPHVEVDWLIGPVPTENDIGRELFIRYTTDLVNEGVFYTDANGRQTMKRVKNYRATYEPANLDAVAGNYYPVTSKIYIEDLNKNIRLSVFNDRAQGGTSLNDGEIDLNLHRVIFTDDTGAQTNLNETENGHGLIIRGKHYLYLTKADYKPNRIYEKILAKEIDLTPQILVSPYNAYGSNSKEKWTKETNEFSGLKSKLPLGIHLLTLEKWNDGTVLLRLENYLEKSDVVKNGVKTVFLKDLFKNLKLNALKETTLSAHMWLKDRTPLVWSKKGKFLKNFNLFHGNLTANLDYNDVDEVKGYEEVNINEGIILEPQEIRTFVVWFDYVDIKIGNTV